MAKKDKKEKAQTRKARLEDQKAVAKATAKKLAAKKAAKEKEATQAAQRAAIETELKSFRRKPRGEVIMTRGYKGKMTTTVVIKKVTKTETVVTTTVKEEMSNRQIFEFIEGQMDILDGEVPMALVIDFTRAGLARVMQLVNDNPNLKYSCGSIFWVGD